MSYNILYLVSSLIGTAPNKQQYYIFKYLNRDIFNLHVLTLSPELSNSIADLYKEINIPVTSLLLNRIEGFFLARKKIKQYIKDNEIDLVHSFGLRADNFSLNLNIPTLSSIRNKPNEQYPTIYGKFIGSYMSHKHLKIIMKIENSIACSYSIADYLKEKYKLNLKVIQNGIDTSFFKNTKLSQSTINKLKNNYGLPVNTKIFLSSCSLVSHKNTEIIIKTFNKYYSNDNRYTLLFAGEGPERKKLEILAEKSDNIIFIGHIKKISDVYKISDYFVSASLSEGLPNSVLEAMSCGLPCVLSDIPEHNEILNNHKDIGIVFDPFSTLDLYKKLIQITKLEYTSTSKKCSDHILKYFNAITVSKEYQNQYFNLVR